MNNEPASDSLRYELLLFDVVTTWRRQIGTGILGRGVSPCCLMMVLVMIMASVGRAQIPVLISEDDGDSLSRIRVTGSMPSVRLSSPTRVSDAYPTYARSLSVADFSRQLSTTTIPSGEAVSSRAFALGQFSSPATTVTAGSHTLLANTAGQQVQISISGGEAVAGTNFRLVIGDGFPDVSGSSIDGPNITGVDISGSVSSTIFTDNNSGQVNANIVNDLPVQFDQFASYTIVTSSGSVTGSGLLATVTLDTTGVSAGSYDFILSGISGIGLLGTEILADGGSQISTTLVDGTLAVVPEPEEYAMIAGLGCLAFAIWRRRQSARVEI